jgi:hypothetical protein
MYELLSSFLDVSPRQGFDAEDSLLVFLLLPALLRPQPHGVSFDDNRFGRIINKVFDGFLART